MNEEPGGQGLRKAGPQPRASITFPPELYRTLEDLARLKKVSLAWIVREAAEMYVAGQPSSRNARIGAHNE